MTAYVLGVYTHPASPREDGLRLEEMVYRTSRAALDAAEVSRRQLDHLTLAACDELDGRPISSMLMAAPAGGYGIDEIKVTDSGASALCLEYARLTSGEFSLGLVTSWCKSSKTDLDSVFRYRADPFFLRPLGIGERAGDALFAQAAGEVFGVSEEEAGRRVVRAYERAARNPRGLRHPVPTVEAVNASPFESTPVRERHRAPATDGAVSLVLASEEFVHSNRECKPIAKLLGVGWATDSFRLDRERLVAQRAARSAWQAAMQRAGLSSSADLDVIELESPTGYHEAVYARIFELDDDDPKVSPSGGAFAQNPVFCTGLVNAAEAVLQVAGQAGPVQVADARTALAHGSFGCAQQGHVVAIFASAGDRP